MATSIQQYARALYEFTAGADSEALDARIKAFAEFLMEERMLKKKNMILAAFEQYAKEQTGNQDISITAAHPLTDESIAQIKSMCKTTGEATIREDKSILGGVKVRKGNMIIDATIKTELERLQRELGA